ncbi:MAG: recombinase family protein [Acidobacteria bacterium]|nr:recombinase family protein [Acidobacteriota bacterium]
MGKSERVREVLTGPLTAGELDRRAAEGWHPVAVEWERLVDPAQDWRPPVQEVPYGLRVAADNKHLEEHAEEVEIMLGILEGIVEDRSMSRIADELNRRGFRMRTDEAWTQSGVFELLPRLIDFSPRLFKREEWIERRRKLRHAAV